MGRTVFADTSFLVALLDGRDALHARAERLAGTLDLEEAALLTSDAVILEFADYFARSVYRSQAGRWVANLRDSGGWKIVPVESALLLKAERRYRLHADKNWSLTDCHSMELMRVHDLRDIASADAGFEQAGFKCLLRE